MAALNAEATPKRPLFAVSASRTGSGGFLAEPGESAAINDT
jgi:hypothetical protein